MNVTEIIHLLDNDGNKYGASGKPRELNLEVNGEFFGVIESAKLDGWGDGLITDVTLMVTAAPEYPREVIVKGNLCWCPNCKAKLRYRNSNGCRRSNLGKYCEHCGARIEYPERM